MRYPHLEHPLSHGRVDLKEIIQSSLPVARASQNDFCDPPFWTIVAISSWNPRKMLQRFNIFWGDIRYSPSFGWILGLRASAGAVHLGCSRPLGPPVCVCVSYTQWNVESRENFQLENSSKTARNGLQLMFKRLIFEGNHAVLYR